MPHISFVYPSMMQPKGTFRNGLMSRWKEAEPLGCSYVEIPANFIKHPREEEITGLEMQQFLTPDAIGSLYRNTPEPDDNIRYIFHTDPSFHHKGRNGKNYPAARLRWNDQGWVNNFTDMLINILDYLGKAADKIEIHPGSEKNVSCRDTALAMRTIRERYSDYSGKKPDIILENRNGSNISNGRDLINFWQAMKDNVPEICDSCGIVLDISVLYNTARRFGGNFKEYLDQVPNEGIKGIHVHTMHGAATPEDEIPWDYAFGKIKQIDGDIFINPEIHHKNKVGYSIDFCNSYLH